MLNNQKSVCPLFLVKDLTHYVCVPMGKLKGKCVLITILKYWGVDSQWERTESLSVIKNGGWAERPHLEVPWTCYSTSLWSEWGMFFFFLRYPLSGQCNRAHRNKNPWARKSWEPTLTGDTGEARGRPQSCRLPVLREMCTQDSSGFLAVLKLFAALTQLCGSPVMHSLSVFSCFIYYSPLVWSQPSNLKS